MLIRRVSSALTFVAAIATVALSTGLAVAALERGQEFLVPPGTPPALSTLAPRCYRATWGVVDALYHPVSISMGTGHLPVDLRLESNYGAHRVRLGESWRALSLANPGDDSMTLRGAVQFSGWKASGRDSIDLLINAFPMMLRLRFANNVSFAHARTKIGWDVGGSELADVVLIRGACLSEEVAAQYPKRPLQLRITPRIIVKQDVGERIRTARPVVGKKTGQARR